MLANVFTHRLAQVIRLTGGRPVAATGSTAPWRIEVPVGPELHDFRESFAPLSDAFLAQVSEWRLPDVDGAYTVTVDFQLPKGHTARATFHGSAAGTSATSSSVALYGDGGTLTMSDDADAELLRHYDRAGGVWADVAVPEAVLQGLPPVQDAVQRSWNLFYRAFVADVQGSERSDYPTFRDGWAAMEIIDAARAARGWVELPDR
jgi:predicted dehydrogenase